MSLISHLERTADAHGARLGVTDLTPLDDVKEEIERRRESGESGGLGFTYREPALSTTPRLSFPWASAIVVVAVPYLRTGDGVGDRPRSVARFADGDRYEAVRSLLEALVAMLGEHGHTAEAVFDDDRLVDRAVAYRSGVAWSGKSTMAITPAFGPWFLIGSVVTDAELTATEPMKRDCGTCDACIPACPTGAIVSPGVLDARRCLAAIFQGRGDIPIQFRGFAGGRVYGCDACLVACPPGTSALSARAASPGPDPRAILRASDRDLEHLARHWYVPGRSMRFVRRNALVAIGNVGTGADIGLLAGFLGHPDPLLRQHAAWALGAIGGDASRSVLESGLESEGDVGVREEIVQALAASDLPSTLPHASHPGPE